MRQSVRIRSSPQLRTRPSSRRRKRVRSPQASHRRRDTLSLVEKAPMPPGRYHCDAELQAGVAQMAECFHGKEIVGGSSPSTSSLAPGGPRRRTTISLWRRLWSIPVGQWLPIIATTDAARSLAVHASKRRVSIVVYGEPRLVPVRSRPARFPLVALTLPTTDTCTKMRALASRAAGPPALIGASARARGSPHDSMKPNAAPQRVIHSTRGTDKPRAIHACRPRGTTITDATETEALCQQTA